MLEDDELTYRAIGCFRWVYNELGYGLLEHAYVAAFVHACVARGLNVRSQVPTPLYFNGAVVTTYRLDLVVERRLIIEIKACSATRPEHVKQVLHYLRSTDLELALLFNFGPSPEIKRFTLRNGLKHRHQRTGPE